jgi:hypothetical protein
MKETRSRLFKYPLRKHLIDRKLKIAERIEKIDLNTFLNRTVDDWVDVYVAHETIEHVRCLREHASVEQGEESMMDSVVSNKVVSGKHRRAVVRLSIPIDGNIGLFHFRPRKLFLRPVYGELSFSDLRVTLTGDGMRGPRVKARIEAILTRIEQHLEWQRSDIAHFNETLPHKLRQAFGERKERLLRTRNLVASIGFPLTARPQSRLTFVAQEVRKKIISAAPIKSTPPFKPEPTLGDDNYKHILTVIENMTTVMERSPTAFRGMDEESIRQHFLVQLNGHFEGAATGETFNYSGKTDILIRVN